MNPFANAQIFDYLPGILNYPFNFEYADISVIQLVPLKANSKDYIATIAQVYFPSEKVDELAKLVVDTNSELYSSYDANMKVFASLIDPQLPLTGLAGKGFSSSGSTTQNKPHPDADNSIGRSGALGGPYNPTNSKSAAVPMSKAKLTGIVVGSICGVTLYIALMIVGVRYFLLRSRGGVELQDNHSFYSSNSGGSSDMITSSEIPPTLYDDKSLFVTANNARMMRASVTPSMKVDNWMDYNNSVNGLGDNNATHSFVNGKITKISGPIASENSLGWDP